jgi:class 3 adenylate cyclase
VSTSLHRRGQFPSSVLKALTSHIGARVGALAGPSEILVSRTVKDLVAGSGAQFVEVGAHRLKGVPDELELLRVH